MKNPVTAVLYCVVFVGLMCGMANAYCIGPQCMSSPTLYGNYVTVDNKTSHTIDVTLSFTNTSRGKGNGYTYAQITSDSSGCINLFDNTFLYINVKLPNGNNVTQSCEGCTNPSWAVTIQKISGKDSPVLQRI